MPLVSHSNEDPFIALSLGIILVIRLRTSYSFSSYVKKVLTY